MDVNQLTLDDQELRAILWCMKDAVHALDEYELGLMERLERVQKLRLEYHSNQTDNQHILNKILEKN